VILDLKGIQYVGSIVPSCSFMVVGISGDSAKIEAHTTDFLQLEHVSNMLESLSGALTSGGIDSALLDFADVKCTEMAAARNSDDEGEATPGASAGATLKLVQAKAKSKAVAETTKKAKAAKPKKRKVRGSDDEGSDDGDADNDSDFGEPAKKKSKSTGSTSKKTLPAGKMIGRSVRVGKKKKLKKA
jgi:hypothetical protein